MEFVVLALSLVGIFMGYRLLRNRKRLGKPPAYLASVGLDRKGQPISFRESLEALQPWWLIMLGFGLLVLSLSLLLQD